MPSKPKNRENQTRFSCRRMRTSCAWRERCHSGRRFRAAVPANTFCQYRRQDPAGIEACSPRRTQAPARRRAERAHNPSRRCRIWSGGHLRWRNPHANAHTPARSGHQLQPLSHDLDLLAHPRLAPHRAQPPARRQWHHRRAGGGLGWLHGRDPENIGDDRRRCCTITATSPPLSANGTTRPPTKRPRWDPSTDGRPATASITSTDSSPVRPRSGNRGCLKISTPVEPPHDEKYHLTEDLADKAIAWLRKHRAYLSRQTVLPVLGDRWQRTDRTMSQGVGRQVQRKVRRRLGRLPRARLQAAEGNGLDSGRTPN